MTGDNRQTWYVFCDDPVMVARLEKIGAERVRSVGEGAEFVLRADQVLLRRGKRQLSEETRLAAAARLRASTRIEAKG